MKQQFAISQSPRLAAKASLFEALGAVSAALAAVPDNVVRLPTSTADAFLLIDPVLSTIHRQLLDTRAHSATLEAMLGANDPMMAALSMQLAALEEAYATRLAALKKRREDGRRNQRADTRDTQANNANVQNLFDVREQATAPKRQEDTLWLWVLIAAYLAHQASAKINGPRLDAA